jgi:hypothetical protein
MGMDIKVVTHTDMRVDAKFFQTIGIDINIIVTYLGYEGRCKYFFKLLV